MPQQISVGIKNIDKSVAGTRHIIMLGGILQRVGDVQFSVDVLDIERSIAGWQIGIGKAARYGRSWILPAPKFAAYKRLVDPLVPSASPLYTDPGADVACNVAFGPPAQAEMVPSSVAKRNGAPPKLLLLLKTIPAGAAGPVLPAGGGTVTTSEAGFPEPL